MHEFIIIIEEKIDNEIPNFENNLINKMNLLIYNFNSINNIQIENIKFNSILMDNDNNVNVIKKNPFLNNFYNPFLQYHPFIIQIQTLKLLNNLNKVFKEFNL